MLPLTVTAGAPLGVEPHVTVVPTFLNSAKSVTSASGILKVTVFVLHCSSVSLMPVSFFHCTKENSYIGLSLYGSAIAVTVSPSKALVMGVPL